MQHTARTYNTCSKPKTQSGQFNNSNQTQTLMYDADTDRWQNCSCFTFCIHRDVISLNRQVQVQPSPKPGHYYAMSRV
jgi:hypothetical protein